LFTLSNSGLAAAYALRVSADGSQTAQPIYSQDNTGLISPIAINMGSSTDKVYLILYGTGFDTAGTVQRDGDGQRRECLPSCTQDPQALWGSIRSNIQLPASLAGKGNVNVQLTAAGVAANPVSDHDPIRPALRSFVRLLQRLCKWEGSHPLW